jgi:hypothetical protein
MRFQFLFTFALCCAYSGLGFATPKSLDEYFLQLELKVKKIGEQEYRLLSAAELANTAFPIGSTIKQSGNDFYGFFIKAAGPIKLNSTTWPEGSVFKMRIFGDPPESVVCPSKCDYYGRKIKKDEEVNFCFKDICGRGWIQTLSNNIDVYDNKVRFIRDGQVFDLKFKAGDIVSSGLDWAEFHSANMIGKIAVCSGVRVDFDTLRTEALLKTECDVEGDCGSVGLEGFMPISKITALKDIKCNSVLYHAGEIIFPNSAYSFSSHDVFVGDYRNFRIYPFGFSSDGKFALAYEARLDREDDLEYSAKKYLRAEFIIVDLVTDKILLKKQLNPDWYPLEKQKSPLMKILKKMDITLNPISNYNPSSTTATAGPFSYTVSNDKKSCKKIELNVNEIGKRVIGCTESLNSVPIGYLCKECNRVATIIEKSDDLIVIGTNLTRGFKK